MGTTYQQQPPPQYYQQQPPQQYYQPQQHQQYYQQQQPPQVVYVQQDPQRTGNNEDCLLACLGSMCACLTMNLLLNAFMF